MKKAIPVLLVLVLISLWAAIASAEESTGDVSRNGDVSDSSDAEKDAGDEAVSEDSQQAEKKTFRKHKGDDDPMAPFAIVPRLGYAWFGPARGDFKIGNLSARNALLVKLGFNMGGSGAGFNLTPFYSYESGDSEFHSAGFNSEFVYRWLIAKKWYPHFGFGGKIGFLFASDIDIGFETFLRIPAGFSYYYLEDLGFIFEFGFGYGLTGIMPKNDDTIYEFTGLRFGHGFMIDMTAGLSFP